jgi:hypothetical protein
VAHPASRQASPIERAASSAAARTDTGSGPPGAGTMVAPVVAPVDEARDEASGSGVEASIPPGYVSSRVGSLRRPGR